MTEQFIAVLLRQSKVLNHWSQVFALLAGLVLAVALLQAAPGLAKGLLMGSLAAAAVQAVFALRLGWDAEFFQLMAQQPQAWPAFDTFLTQLKLAKPTPERPLLSRAQGALGLMRRQALAVCLQGVCLGVGVVCF